MSEGLSYDHQTTTMDTDNVVAAAPTHSDQPLTEEAVTANEGDDVPQIPDDEPSLSNAPVVQGEDLPPSSVEHSAPASSYEDTVVDHPAAADQSALQPPESIDLLSPPITTPLDHLPQGAQPPAIVNGAVDDSPLPQSGDLPPFRQSDYFLGPAPAFMLSERSSLTADSLKGLGARSNNASNEPLALAAGGVAGVEPEDKEALGDSPAEEPIVSRGKSKGSKHKMRIVVGALVAILIIVLIVVLAVYFAVVKKKDNVNASTAGSGGSPTGTGTAAKPTSTGKAGNHIVSVVFLRSLSDFFFLILFRLTDGRRRLHDNVSQRHDVHVP